jgi:hypothetical protein
MALQDAEKFDAEGGGGFNSRINADRIRGALQAAEKLARPKITKAL